MNWIADTTIAGLALWATLILSGLLAGMFVARWNAIAAVLRAQERMLLAAAAAGVIAWFANAGSLIGGSASPLFVSRVPIAVETGYRLAVLWATLPGAALTFAVVLLARASLAGPRSGARHRFIAVLAVLALLASGVAVWFMPAPDATSTTIPPFVQSAPAALAPLFALAALLLLIETVAVRFAGTAPRRLTLVRAWVCATLAVAAEQMARGTLGIGPRDPVVFGSAASGLVLWLITSALLHRRAQAVVFSTANARLASTTAAVTAHLGAILLVISFGAHAFASRVTVSLPQGTPITVTDSFRRSWALTNQGVSRFDEEGALVLSLALEATSLRATALLTPEIREYHGRNGEHLANSVGRRHSTGAITQTLRVLLLGADSLDVASVRVTFLPLPVLWPVGLALLAGSALMARDRVTERSSTND